MRSRITRVAAALIPFLLPSIALGAPPDRTDPRVAYAARLLAEAGLSHKVVLAVAGAHRGPESFDIRVDARIHLNAGGPGGLLYGARELIAMSKAGKLRRGFTETQNPDFQLRGNALFLMKDGSYSFQLTPKEFPWFYDKKLLTRYLDYLFANRFNAIFLWSGCLFPSIVEMPEYPDATDLPKEQLLRNQAQFRWFTDECAKRNISVLMHFYNIQIPGPMARARKIPLSYSKPTEFTAKLIGYCLKRFLTEFKSVGLYVCPGEALDPRYTAKWINDVVFSAARESGHEPTIVVRDWGLDAKGLARECIGKYGNLYTELKHNIEMIVSPVPDTRHAIWRNLGVKHIVNLHEVADVKPFRWGSPAFVREMAGEWRKAGIDGAEVYSMVSWRWPYTCDKLSPNQAGFWPQGNKLVTFDRDAVWLESVGRYLWKVDRNPKDEAAYWRHRLAVRFGTAKAGDLIRRWYELTGPILPGLQNLTSVLNMNFYPTVVGREQSVDAILDARVPKDAKAAPKSNYVSKPVDSVFFALYKREYGLASLIDRMSMPVSQFAGEVAEGRRVTSSMTPDKITALLVKMAGQAKTLAENARRAATRNRDEAGRFVTDSEGLVLVAKAWEHKVDAAIMKGAWLKTGKREFAQECLKHLRDSVKVYEDLVALTDKTYLNPTDMLMSLNWHEGLDAFKADLAKHEEALAK